jgi:c(7)-type cytochrome triheme protein
MSRRWTFLLILLLVALPSVLYGRWIKDKVYLETESVGKIEFSHYAHMDTVGKDCPSCHNEIYHIVTKNNPPFTMSQMEEGKACGACHNSKDAFSVTGDCATCHGGEVAIRTEDIGSVNFSHKVHVEMFGCDECHPDLFEPESNASTVTMKAMEDGESCGACHDGDTAFGVAEDCTSCHTVKEIAIQTADVGSVAFSHDLHIEMFGCGECHPDLFQAKSNASTVTMKAMKDGESCGACHDGDTAFGVGEDCTTCHAGDILYVNEDAGNITFPHAAHTEAFGCDECHPDLFQAKRGANEATMEEMESGESCGACHDGDTAFGVAEDCESCHAM